jgi:hypothetical protein
VSSLPTAVFHFVMNSPSDYWDTLRVPETKLGRIVACICVQGMTLTAGLPRGTLEDPADQIEENHGARRHHACLRIPSDGACVIAPKNRCFYVAKSPSNRGRTSDLGIAQCFLYSPTLFQLSYRRGTFFRTANQ